MRSKYFRSTPGHTMDPSWFRMLVPKVGLPCGILPNMGTPSAQIKTFDPDNLSLNKSQLKKIHNGSPCIVSKRGHGSCIWSRQETTPGSSHCHAMALVISWSSWLINGRWKMVNNGEHGLCVSFCPEWRTFLDLGFLKIVSSMVSKRSHRFCRVSRYIYFPNICPAYPC